MGSARGAVRAMHKGRSRREGGNPGERELKADPKAITTAGGDDRLHTTRRCRDIPSKPRDVLVWRPEIVAEVSFVEWRPDGLLRYVVYVGE